MTEQAAKLTVKVKLHAAQPVVLPTQVPPARLSKLKLALGVLFLLLLIGIGYSLWQFIVASVPSSVAAQPQTLQQPPPVKREAMAGNAALSPLISPKETVVDANMAKASAAPAVTTAVTPVDEPVATPVGSMEAASPVAVNPTERLPEGFSRIVLTATMEQLEPGERIENLVAEKQIQRLYLFTELQGYASQQLIHRWTFAGKVQAEVLLTIEDSPWRTYSEKWLLPNQLGTWRVEIIDQQQRVLYQHDFLYQ